MSLAEPIHLEDESFPKPWRNSLLGAAGLGLLLIVVVAFTGAGPSVLGLLLTTAAGSLAAGIAFGFLFGVPKADPEKTTGRYLPNTSLEQISDWLTKLIIGATLVQLGAIGSALGSFFQDVAGSMGTGVNAVIPGAIAIYFAVLGFMGSWLLTRLRLARAFSVADQALATLTRQYRELEVQRQAAEEQGDTDEVERLDGELERLRAVLNALTGDMMAIRQLEPPSEGRTRRLEAIYDAQRQAAAASDYSSVVVQNLYESGGESRVSALAMMYEHPEQASASLLLTSIRSSQSAFEQYQALTVALEALEHLADDERDQLRVAIEEQMGPGGWIKPGTDRHGVATDIMSRMPN